MGRYDEILTRFMAFAVRFDGRAGRFRRAERPPGGRLHDAVGAESI